MRCLRLTEGGAVLAALQLADREGFEPSVRFHVHTLSRRARSTTLASVHFSPVQERVRWGGLVWVASEK